METWDQNSSRRSAFALIFPKTPIRHLSWPETLRSSLARSIEIIHVTVNFSLSPPVHATYMPIEYDPKFIEEVTQAALKSIKEKYV